MLLLCRISLFSQITGENEPAKVVQDVNLYQYIPFREGNKLVALDRSPGFRLGLYENLPRLDGATALYPVYASFVQTVYPTAVYPVLDYSQLYTGIVKCTQTPRAYENLINGDTDVVFCAEPSKDQIAKAAEKGVSFNLTPIGIDAFVFFVNKNNPIDNITSEQVRAIYSGKTTNWSCINGIDEPIIAYQRPKNSGSQTILEQVIMADREVMEPLMENVAGGMGGIVEQVASYTNYANAIGYSFLFFVTEMVNNDEIKLISIDGIFPSKEAVQKNEYPFAGTFYAITTGNETENAKKFIEWILSDEAQYLIEKTGYIPIK
jgi:phosphate transport system substrate-binding protein